MAYAAITSLLSTTHESLWKNSIASYTHYYKIQSLRTIMEKSYNIKGDIEDLTRLEAEIIELACITEDMINSESRKVSLAKNQISRRIAVWKLNFLLKRAVGRIDFTVKKWIGMLNSKDLKAQNLTLESTSQHALQQTESMMIGCENEFEMIRDQLTRGTSQLDVVSVVGMGGIGKTTLANKIYNDQFILFRFDIRAKATVSQEYCARNVLLRLLSSVSGSRKIDESYEQQDDGQLADRLQKFLKSRRYLIFIDDIWAKEAWDDVKLCFPDCDCGSRILLTTRNMEVAKYASSGETLYQMSFLNHDESWNLLRVKVFEDACFPPEFEKVGKQIALNCKGLPLAIVVIAGLLLKIGKSLDEWKSVSENITSLISTDLEVQCMRVLALSYHHLPHHLKSVFLYFAIFPEDELISVDKLVNLWVAEGFSLEQYAEQCLTDLIGRSLIFIHHLSFDGKIKACGMHDVIRELCLREAQNLNFVNAITEDQNSCEQTRHFSTKRRVSVQSELSSFAANQLATVHHNMARSVLLFIRNPSNSGIMHELERFKVLRILELASPTLDAFPSCVVDLSLLRYLALTFYSSINDHDINIPPSISRLQYLETFILKFPKYYGRPKISFTLPGEIFKMSQLRNLSLDRNNMVPHKYEGTLRNLQCLSGWNPLYCDYHFTQQVRFLRKLQICGNQQDYIKSNEMKGLHDPRSFIRLQELKFDGMPHSVLPPLEAFPKNLMKLALTNTCVNLKDLRILGKLPKLEALKLKFASSNYIGSEWKVAEEGFPQLKFLLLNRLNIKYWRASSDQFPCLERLFLEECLNMDSIPEDFAEITTLQLIDIRMCKESVLNSAEKIQKDVEDNYGGSIEVHFRYIL
ncbi:putative late blight resistance protein homolog R1B-16 [Capsicum annuum]|nr:putative late blight resistance protein homolog R1B-16 [Capsicum annuum]XP_047261980.1 putative late blight resistance protein homolog R1B-16 [Capsicum annuum]